jgi:hypothetical protein
MKSPVYTVPAKNDSETKRKKKNKKGSLPLPHCLPKSTRNSFKGGKQKEIQYTKSRAKIEKEKVEMENVNVKGTINRRSKEHTTLVSFALASL